MCQPGSSQHQTHRNVSLRRARSSGDYAAVNAVGLIPLGSFKNGSRDYPIFLYKSPDPVGSRASVPAGLISNVHDENLSW